MISYTVYLEACSKQWGETWGWGGRAVIDDYRFELIDLAGGYGTAAAEQRKRDQYGARCQAEGLQFVPFAVDEFGHIGDAGQALLQQLAAAKAASGRGDFREGRTVADRRACLLRAWRSRVAWAVHEGMHESMQRRLRLARQPAGLGPGGVAL